MSLGRRRQAEKVKYDRGNVKLRRRALHPMQTKNRASFKVRFRESESEYKLHTRAHAHAVAERDGEATFPARAEQGAFTKSWLLSALKRNGE